MVLSVLSRAQEGLHEIAVWLIDQKYEFTTVTPETHRRALSRLAGRRAESLRDVFGWNLDFDPNLLPSRVLDYLQQASAVSMLENGLVKSEVRFSSLDGLPYVHSAYPTDKSDSVFFGPDTYRFVSLIQRALSNSSGPSARVVDIGCGAGAGGLVASRLFTRRTGRAPQVEFVDVNARALELAQVNVATFGVADAAFWQSNLYHDVAPSVDLIVSNPPYLVDEDERLYRHGGGATGSALSERIVGEGLPLLAPGGTLVLYTGSAIVEGEDRFRSAALRLIDRFAYDVAYRELDPDVFGEELDREAYRDVDRIAAVALIVRRRAPGDIG